MSDIKVENHGSLFVFHPMTPEAHAWIDDNIQGEEVQFWAGGVVVEPRYARDLADGMIADGLTVE
jgi:hypothetical protein